MQCSNRAGHQASLAQLVLSVHDSIAECAPRTDTLAGPRTRVCFECREDSLGYLQQIQRGMGMGSIAECASEADTLAGPRPGIWFECEEHSLSSSQQTRERHGAGSGSPLDPGESSAL